MAMYGTNPNAGVDNYDTRVARRTVYPAAPAIHARTLQS